MRVKSVEAAQPMVREWFERLTGEERALCLSTIDPQIVERLKSMCKQLLKNT